MKMGPSLTDSKMPNRFCLPTTRLRSRRFLSRATGSSVTTRCWAKSRGAGWESSTALGTEI